MATKPKTCRPVHANRGIEAKYRKALKGLIAEMTASVEYWLTAGYRKHPPPVAALVAQDASVSRRKKAATERRRAEWQSKYGPSGRMKSILDDLVDRWLKKFEEQAPKIAETYLQAMFNASDSAFRQSLKDAGIAVEFEMTPAVKDALNASLAENVSLIKSIPEQYLQQVAGAVMRSYAAGRDLASMVQDLKKLHPQAENRAVLIARDQSNKANAVVNRARQMELGFTDAIWMHSHAGKTPRPDHVAADGKRYKIAEGCPISGEYLQPGEAINCRCTSRPVIPF